MSFARRLQLVTLFFAIFGSAFLSAQTDNSTPPAQSPAPSNAPAAQPDTSAASTQSPVALVNIKKIYVEPMENHLDQYLTSEISRQFKGSLEVVTDRGNADAILKGVNLGVQNTTKGTVDLVDPSGKVVLWSGSAADRENKFLDLKHGGLQTIAGHLVKSLKKAMQPK